MKERSGIICAGNWIVDLMHEVGSWPREHDLARVSKQTVSIGGGAANVASIFGNLKTSIPIWPMGAISDDEYGRLILKHCRMHRFQTHLIEKKPYTSTAHTHVISVPGQSRTLFYQGGANDLLNADDFSPKALALPNARIFYLGYLMLLDKLDKVRFDGSSGGAEVLARAREAGMITCVDLVSEKRDDYAKSVSVALPHIDYLLLNATEAARATETEENDTLTDDNTLSAMALKLVAGGVQHAVIIHTQGKALWASSNGTLHWLRTEIVPQSEVVSPLGAGDAFCSGVLYGLHEGLDIPKTLQLAHVIAAASLRAMNASDAVPELAVVLEEVKKRNTAA